MPEEKRRATRPLQQMWVGFTYRFYERGAAPPPAAGLAELYVNAILGIQAPEPPPRTDVSFRCRGFDRVRLDRPATQDRD